MRRNSEIEARDLLVARVAICAVLPRVFWQWALLSRPSPPPRLRGEDLPLRNASLSLHNQEHVRENRRLSQFSGSLLRTHAASGARHRNPVEGARVEKP